MSQDESELKTAVRKLRNRIKDPQVPFGPDAEKLIEVIKERGVEPDVMNPRIFDVIHCAILRTRENMIDESTAKTYLLLLEHANLAAHRGYFTKKQAATLQKWTATITERCSKVIEHQPLVNEEALREEEELHDPKGPRRLRVAETVLSRRTNQVALVLERCFNNLNHQAVLRTAECLGIQYIYAVNPVESKRQKISKKLTKGNDSWLTIKRYDTTTECITDLQAEGREIWATDLSQESVSLEGEDFVIPPKVAIVVGNETDGVSQEMLNAAEKRIYLPIHGFSESLNLGVASALVLQRILSMCPKARGNLTTEEKSKIRKDWYLKLANNDKQEALFTKWLDHPPAPIDDLRRCDDFKNNQSWVHKRIHKRLRDLEAEREAAASSPEAKKACQHEQVQSKTDNSTTNEC